jgi:HSP20 family protein
MVLRRWNPFTELRQMQENMNRLWQGFSPTTDDGSEMERWSMPLDVCQEGDNMMVYASIPGVNPDDIDISIEDNVLTIRGQTKAEYEGHNGNYLMRECRTGSFYRALRLPDTVDFDKAQTHYEHGVLRITFPKVETKRARHLKVGSSSNVLEGSSV